MAPFLPRPSSYHQLFLPSFLPSFFPLHSSAPDQVTPNKIYLTIRRSRSQGLRRGLGLFRIAFSLRILILARTVPHHFSSHFFFSSSSFCTVLLFLFSSPLFCFDTSSDSFLYSSTVLFFLFRFSFSRSLILCLTLFLQPRYLSVVYLSLYLFDSILHCFPPSLHTLSDATTTSFSVPTEAGCDHHFGQHMHSTNIHTSDTSHPTKPFQLISVEVAT